MFLKRLSKSSDDSFLFIFLKGFSIVMFLNRQRKAFEGKRKVETTTTGILKKLDERE